MCMCSSQRGRGGERAQHRDAAAAVRHLHGPRARRGGRPRRYGHTHSPLSSLAHAPSPSAPRRSLRLPRRFLRSADAADRHPVPLRDAPEGRHRACGSRAAAAAARRRLPRSRRAAPSRPPPPSCAWAATCCACLCSPLTTDGASVLFSVPEESPRRREGSSLCSLRLRTTVATASSFSCLAHQSSRPVACLVLS